MSVIKELLRTEEDGTISFGNYELDQKSKLSDFEYNGDAYKVKTFREITKLEKNGMLVYESVPGTAVSMAKQRVMEARKLGFTTVILPEACKKSVGEVEGMELRGVRTVRDVMYLMA